MSEKIEIGDRCFVKRGEYAGRIVVVRTSAPAIPTPLGMMVACVEGAAIFTCESEGSPFLAFGVQTTFAALCGCNLKKIPPLAPEEVPRERLVDELVSEI